MTHVQFMIVSDGDTIITSCTLYHGLYRLDVNERLAHDACIVFATRVLRVMQSYVRFGHLNFGSFLCLKRQDMVFELPQLESPARHVYEGCILVGAKCNGHHSQRMDQ